MNLMRRAGHRIRVPLNNRAELVLINHRERERTVEFNVSIAIVLIQHAFECRAGVFENMIVKEHITLLHVDKGLIASGVLRRWLPSQMEWRSLMIGTQ